MKNISVIIPCYQNEGSIPVLANRLLELQEKMAEQAVFSYVLVNDGSTDNTLKELVAFKERIGGKVKVVKLIRNFGSYNSFLAGMAYSEGNCHIYLHADLQDPPELIEQMFHYFEKGSRLVIAFRQNREDQNIFSNVYHRMVKKFAIRDIPPGGFDLMLFDDEIRKQVIAISEKNTNIVYLFSWLGYPYTAIPYTRVKREYGTSQWKFGKKVKLFVDTFFSFSNLPLYMLRILSLFCIVTGLCMAVWTLISIYQSGKISSLDVLLLVTTTLCFSFGAALGILGEYMSRVHETLQNRPNYIVDEVI